MNTGWWAGDNDERYAVGPCATRQEAIDEAIAQCVYQELDPEPPEHPDWRIAIYVCEADSPELTDMTVDADDVLERLESRYEWGDPDGDPMFTDVTRPMTDDLTRRLTEAFRAWVTEHNLALHYSAFQDHSQLPTHCLSTRHEECVELPHPNDGKNND